MSYQMKESFIDYSQINAFTHHFYQGTSSSTGGKSQPNFRHKIPTGVKSVRNLRQEIPTGVKYEPNLGEGFPHRAKVCQNLGEGFAYPA